MKHKNVCIQQNSFHRITLNNQFSQLKSLLSRFFFKENKNCFTSLNKINKRWSSSCHRKSTIMNLASFCLRTYQFQSTKKYSLESSYLQITKSKPLFRLIKNISSVISKKKRNFYQKTSKISQFKKISK